MALGIGDVAGGVGKVAGFFGGLFGDDKEARARQAEEEALNLIKGVRLPTLEELQLHPELQQYVGDYIAAQEQAQQLGPSQMQQIQTDPQYKQAQLQALQRLQSLGTEGMTATERAQFNEMRRQAEGAEKGRQQAILQNMAERGAGGSGAELAARLQSSQSEANRASAEGDRLAAQMQQRALEAIMSGGQLGGQIRGQEFQEEADKAKAADAIARFNLENLQSVGQRNISAQNEAALRNIQTRQGIQGANVGIKNAAELNRQQQLASDYERRQQQAADQAAILKNRISSIRGEKSEPNLLTKIGTGIGNIGEGVSQAQASGLFGSPSTGGSSSWSEAEKERIGRKGGFKF